MTASKKLSPITTLLLLLAIFTCFFTVGGAAYAAEATAADWGGIEAGTLWYFKDSQLGLTDLKAIADGWKTALGDKEIDPVIIAVVDTGIESEHPIFGGTLLQNASGNPVVYNSYNAVTVDSSDPEYAQKIADVEDRAADTHGTAVAGVMAMMIRELGLEDYIKLVPVKSTVTGTTGDGKTAEIFKLAAVTEAIKWSADTLGASVINMSFGVLGGEGQKMNENYESDAGLLKAIQSASARSVLVAAAGNQNKDSAKNPFYPAAHDGVVGVMGHTAANQKYTTSESGSNYGDSYDLFAPGAGIYSPAGADGYQTLSGTSMAAPFVSVAAALFKLRFEVESAISDLDRTPSAGAVARILRTSGDDDGRILFNAKSYSKLSLKNMMTKEYTDDDLGYSTVTGLTVFDENGLLGDNKSVTMMRNEVKTLELTARLTPLGETDPDLEALVEWILVGYEVRPKEEEPDKTEEVEISAVTLGKGAHIEYTPELGGKFKLMAQIRLGDMTYSDEVRYEVVYLPYISGNVLIVESSDLGSADPRGGINTYTDDVLTFTLTGIEYVDRTVEIKWFVNGNYVHSGLTFELRPERKGEYEITARYGEMPPVQNVMTVKVRPAVARPCNIFTVTACGLIAIAVIMALTIIIRAKARKER